MATLILKVTEACNGNCLYCDVVAKDRPAVTTMTDDVLEMLFLRGRDYLEADPRHRLELIWHGGEPLLPGPAFYERVLTLQQKHCGTVTDRITHAVQTNLTLFDDDFARVFRKLGITAIGTSYEPLPGLRALKDGGGHRAYARRFFAGLRTVERWDFRWGMIYVVTRPALETPVEIFRFLTNLVPRGAITFNPVLLYGDRHPELAVTPDEYCDFLAAVAPLWWEHKERWPAVQPLATLARNLETSALAVGCQESGACAQSHCNVAPDGQTSLCGRSSDWGLLDFGNLKDRSLAEIFADPQRRSLMDRNRILAEGPCQDCRFWAICHGGCPLDAWSSTKSFAERTPWCASRKNLLEGCLEPLVGTRFSHPAKAEQADPRGATRP